MNSDELKLIKYVVASLDRLNRLAASHDEEDGPHMIRVHAVLTENINALRSLTDGRR